MVRPRSLSSSVTIISSQPPTVLAHMPMHIPMNDMNNMHSTPDSQYEHLSPDYYGPLIYSTTPPLTNWSFQPHVQYPRSAPPSQTTFSHNQYGESPDYIGYRRRSDNDVLYSSGSRPPRRQWESLVTEGDDLHCPNPYRQLRKLSPIGSHRHVAQPQPLAPTQRGSRPLLLQVAHEEAHRDRTPSRPVSAPPFLFRSVGRVEPLPSPPGLPASGRTAEHLARIRANYELESKFISLKQLRKPPQTTRGPFGTKLSQIDERRPAFGSPWCAYSCEDCLSSQCATCKYLRCRGDGLRYRLLKRDKDIQLWRLGVSMGDQHWPYAEESYKLRALQASYMLGREHILRRSSV